MAKYTPEAIENFKYYLNHWVEDFGGDETIAQELIDNEDWSEVEVMMARGDDYANNYSEEDENL